MSPDPGTASPLARVHAALAAAVPVEWQSVVTDWRIIGGSSSWTWPDRSVEITERHATGPWSRLLEIVAHEVGHAVAIAYGTDVYHGAPPEGFPIPSSDPELWAACVARAWTGSLGDHRGPHCPPEGVQWAAKWLDANRTLPATDPGRSYPNP